MSFHFPKPQFPHPQNGGVNDNACLFGKGVAHTLKALPQHLALGRQFREAVIAALTVLGPFSSLQPPSHLEKGQRVPRPKDGHRVQSPLLLPTPTLTEVTP